ncbi:hypothetical protein ACTQ1U_10405 [Thermoguttaceae bacterium LCP21S3_D4]|nr:hypothetical protein [Lachnospiraceae bacterium]
MSWQHSDYYPYVTSLLRASKNFMKYNDSSGNRHKFTSMFICTLLARPCASIASFREKF